MHPEHPSAIYAILTDAVNFRLSQIIEENELKVLALSVKLDCFDFGKCRNGHIEMDTLFHTESVSSIDAYLYDAENNLLAKASCTLQYEKERRVPAH